MSEPLVLSRDRARRIKIALWLALVPASLVAMVALYLLLRVVPEEPDALRYGVVVAVVAALLLTSMVKALRRLPQRDQRAKTDTVVAGTLTTVAALPLAAVWIGYPLALLGLVLLLLSLLPDEPDK